MRTPTGAMRAFTLLVAALLVTGCGVRPQERPEPVTTAAAPSTDTGNGSSAQARD